MNTGPQPIPSASTAERSEESLELVNVVAFLLRYWRWVASGAVSGGIVALIAAFVMTPVYRAQAVVVPAGTERTSALAGVTAQLGPLASVLGGLDLRSGGDDKQLWLGTLRSREILRRFVQDLALLPVLFPECLEAPAKRWLIPDRETCEPTLNEAVDFLERKVFFVSEDRRSGLVTVTVEWRDPDLAAEWANRLVEMTNDLLRRRAIEEAQRNIAYLEAELEKTTVVERQQIIYRLIESRTSEIMLANGRPQYAFVVVDKAMPPDPDKFVRPKRALLTVVGMLTGALAATMLALGAAAWKGRR